MKKVTKRPVKQVRSGRSRKDLPQHLNSLLKTLSTQSADEVLRTIVAAANSIAGSDRVRLYLDDDSKEKLICREALGAHQDEFKREPITIASNDWKLTESYRSGVFVEVRDTTADDGCNQDVARRLQLNSAWLFPIYQPDRGGGCVGVLCVDNPFDKGQPTEGAKVKIETLLERSSRSLVRAKQECDRRDLSLRVTRLTALHKTLLTPHPAEQVLGDLFQEAATIVPNLSLATVRRVRGYSRGGRRLEIADVWPRDLLQVFSRPELRVVDETETFADQDDILNVQEKRKELPSLNKFLGILEGHGFQRPLRTLRSFPLIAGDDYFGRCNFYTSTSRKFTEPEQQALLMIVTYAAAALYNAQRIESAGRDAESLKILSDCISMTATASPVVLIREITRRLGRLFDIHAATWIEADESAHELRVEYTWPEHSTVDNDIRRLEWGFGIAGRAIVMQEPYVLCDRDPEWHKEYVELVPGIRTCAAIPLKSPDGKVIAALALESMKEDAFLRQDIQHIEAIVQQVHVAMNNATLLSDLREAKRELEEKHWTEAMGTSTALAVHRVAHQAGSIPSEVRAIRKVLMDQLLDERVQRAVNDRLTSIERDSNTMLDIADRLSKSGEKPQAFKTVSVKSLIQRIIDGQRQGDSEVDVECHVEIGGDVAISTDPDKLGEIVECLLENAFRAARIASRGDAGRVARVTARVESSKNDGVIIDIVDSGNGVPRNLARDLCRTLVTSNWDGHGIGLFVSNRQAGQLGGRITLSDNSNNGATFRLALPTVDQIG